MAEDWAVAAVLPAGAGAVSLAREVVVALAVVSVEVAAEGAGARGSVTTVLAAPCGRDTEEIGTFMVNLPKGNGRRQGSC
jgi:hypothetical protein